MKARLDHVAGIETGRRVVTRHAETIGVVGAFGCLMGLIVPASAAPSTSIELEQGRAVYQRHCSDCHGPEGRGDGPQATSLSPRPGNLISAQTSAKSDQELMKIIAKGRPRTAMTGWEDRLSAEEQAAVLGYIRSLVKFTRSATPAPPQP
jgi:mono/diheme cytochrome c family protein